MIKNRFLLVVAGPTASGKTELAVRLADYFTTEIISADSRQFYKEIPIGTSAPERKYLQKVKHHFVGNLSIFDNYNVSRYEKEVLLLLDDLWKQKEVVIMTGGSGLYIDAVCKGIDELPDPDEELRGQLKNDYQTKGLETLQAQLKVLDPEYYLQVDLKNPKRLMRAIEVCLQTGKKYSDLRKNRPQTRDFKTIKIGLELPREELFTRIDTRAEKMLQNGWLEEAKKVFPYRHLNALNTVGYKELFAYLNGETDMDFALDKIKTNTRRYAKRQMTWFKKDKDTQWFHSKDWGKIVSYTDTILNG